MPLKKETKLIQVDCSHSSMLKGYLIYPGDIICVSLPEFAFLHYLNSQALDIYLPNPSMDWVSPHHMIAKMLDCYIIVSKFELQLYYYFCFQINTLEKGMKPFILLAMGSIVPLLLFYKDGFDIK